MFGWYYEEGSVQDEDSDMWRLLERAVPDAASKGRLHSLRAGPMAKCLVDDYLDGDDIAEMRADKRLTPAILCDEISERHRQAIKDGYARLADGSEEGFDSDRDVMVLAWVAKFIELEPKEYCEGQDPLPIEYIDGAWRFGDLNPEPQESQATIVYTTEPSPETGHVGWCWWALGKMGDAKTLAEAKTKCEAIIDRRKK